MLIQPLVVLIFTAVALGTFLLSEVYYTSYFATIAGILFISTLTYNKRYIWGFHGLFNLAIPSIVLSIYTVIIAIPSIYIAGTLEETVRSAYTFAVVSFYFVYPLGLLIGDILMPIKPARFNDVYVQEKVKKELKVNVRLLYALVTFSLILFLFYMYKAKTAPFLELIFNPGDAAKYALMREGAFKTLSMNRVEQYLFSWNRSLLVPIIAVITTFYMREKKNFSRYAIGATILSYGFFVNIITLEKAPAASLFITILVAIYLSRKNRNVKFILYGIVISFIIPLSIYYLLQFGRDDIWRVIFLSLLLRLFIMPAQALSWYFVIFPQIHEFLLGRSSQLFSWMHVEGTFPVSNYVMKIWWDNPTTTGFANAIYLGNYWADFGIYGVLIAHLFFGFIIHLTYASIVNASKYSIDLKYIIGIAIAVPIFTFGFFSSNFTILYITRGLIVWLAFLFYMNKKQLFHGTP
ncbi:MAG: oligosaccharide repeat unit polymerase [Candidatus Marinimicrobia bacterium]|nr:oligosaccharide repeat unit polymerase [Candidatus Neomarinimicrobiota bacterium]MBT3825456.1 oligosaccharide repeat unit polymerase [Candidatus Neomarinimicrobiota bacterium]MBT5315378.1 oligosaccharide repeat unit polymerase [Candidatus Neomarinimicrobiota bacterium]MBT6760281.1 oligosaccharide repeat unit polymerase [Candidatus Neomarinimicrobiota bacterium]MBT7201424.1 oligosaccharide repeat unit polymerase [Candidatus Neomarinimicrobiota bacterium]